MPSVLVWDAGRMTNISETRIYGTEGPVTEPILSMMMTTSTMRRSDNFLSSVELLHANDSFLAVHKNAGIPCQSRSKKPPFPLDRVLEQYLNESLRIWTRIDQPVSGIVLFHREQEYPKTASLNITEKTYLAIVEGHPIATGEQTITSHISREGRRMKAIEDTVQGKRADLSFKVVKTFDNYSLLNIKPITGRFHQIRFQLAQMGHPVKGDVKYGARRKNHNRSIHLHATEYVIRQDNGSINRIMDLSFPNDPLWSMARKSILQESR